MLNRISCIDGLVIVVHDLQAAVGAWTRLGFEATPLVDAGFLQLQSMLFADVGPVDYGDEPFAVADVRRSYGVHLLAIADAATLPTALAFLAKVPDRWPCVVLCTEAMARAVRKLKRARLAAGAAVAVTAHVEIAGNRNQIAFSLLSTREGPLPMPWLVSDLN